jgi:hypothetical protein
MSEDSEDSDYLNIENMFSQPMPSDIAEGLLFLVQDYYSSLEYLQQLTIGLRARAGALDDGVENDASDEFQEERRRSVRKKKDIEDIEVGDLIEEALKQVPGGHHLWYEKSLNYTKRILGVEEQDPALKLFMKVLAATSNNANPKGNFTLAIKALRQHISGEDLGGFYPVVIQNLNRVFSGKEMSGPKVSAFYKNLIGDQTAVTLDAHMWEIIYGARRGTPLRQRYAVMIIGRVAMDVGLTNAQTQAALWAANHFRKNRVPGDYLSEIEKRQSELIEIFSELKLKRGL